jgi:hypothetical protein
VRWFRASSPSSIDGTLMCRQAAIQTSTEMIAEGITRTL